MIITDRFYFLNNPHTGSRTCMEVFLKLGAKPFKRYGHHIPPEFIPNDKPKVAVIRNPVTCLESWYADYYLNEPNVEEWLDRFNFPFDWEKKETLNIYEDYVDYYFIYEEGLANMFKTLGYSIESLPRVGKNKYKPSIDPKIVQKYFPEDWALYDKVLGGYKTWPKGGNVVAANIVGGQLSPMFMGKKTCDWSGTVTGCDATKPPNGDSFKYCPFCGNLVKS